MDRAEFWVSLMAGGIAGMCVDLVLFPLDTIKTRLQSPQGFKKAGGFREIYAGVPSVAVGSFPNAAAFFVTYEFVKSMLATATPRYLSPVTHMAAASFGEVVPNDFSVSNELVQRKKIFFLQWQKKLLLLKVACLIRVPSEVVKQRAQVSPSSSTFQVLSNTLYQEIPFSLVQFPVWEALKDLWSWKQGHVVDSWQSATCGAFAGGFAAVITTPLDVAKTRIMLAKAGSSNASGNVFSALHSVWRSQGLPGLFAGVVPRMTAISLGGFIFLGTYDKTRRLLL
ncbi:S-adenosylmethionine mitochondrial carrier protein isoform X2 [Chelonia mydas]|uniref:S-adenosylmethionine mitochondrial carrier protein isoform X2 n=1 Tax=Chelonia mydas TaxID=8469 RepID=UPI0018A1C3C7|nr:S-adenosylmethionine mitochondrial carrier protein isoform X2 [Chelonia mydas]